jgi:hypothetical protein
LSLCTYETFNKRMAGQPPLAPLAVLIGTDPEPLEVLPVTHERLRFVGWLKTRAA